MIASLEWQRTRFPGKAAVWGADGETIYRLEWPESRPITWTPHTGWTSLQWGTTENRTTSTTVVRLLDALPPGSWHVRIWWTPRMGRLVDDSAATGGTYMPDLPFGMHLAAAAWDEDAREPVRELLSTPDWVDRAVMPLVDVLEVMIS